MQHLILYLRLTGPPYSRADGLRKISVVSWFPSSGQTLCLGRLAKRNQHLVLGRNPKAQSSSCSFQFFQRRAGGKTKTQRRRLRKGKTHPISIRFAGGARGGEDGELLLLPADESGGHCGGAAQLLHRAQPRPPRRAHRHPAARPRRRGPRPLPRQLRRVRLRPRSPLPIAVLVSLSPGFALGAGILLAAATTSPTSS